MRVNRGVIVGTGMSTTCTSCVHTNMYACIDLGDVTHVELRACPSKAGSVGRDLATPPPPVRCVPVCVYVHVCCPYISAAPIHESRPLGHRVYVIANARVQR